MKWIQRAEYIANHVRYVENAKSITENEAFKVTSLLWVCLPRGHSQDFHIMHKKGYNFRMRRALEAPDGVLESQ